MFNLAKALAVLSALLSLCSNTAASVVYDNSTYDLNQIYFGGDGVEYGNQINLAGTDRIVTDFQFEYFLGAGASGDESVQLRFYSNDGPVITETASDGTTRQIQTPGTLLYTSPVLTLQTGNQTAEALNFAVTVPNSFTWTVTFNGISSTETAGLRIYSPPAIGSSFDDFWQKNNGSWNTYLIDNGATPANFAARVTAVPEPGTLALALLAGLGWVGYLGLRRRSS